MDYRYMWNRIEHEKQLAVHSAWIYYFAVAFRKKCSPLTTTNNDLPQKLRVLNEREKKSENEKKYK